MKTSEKTGALSPALVKALSEMPTLVKDADNPFYRSKYIELSSIIADCRPVLAAQGLAVMQGVSGRMEDGRTMLAVTTRILHSSGEWIEETLEIPVEKKSARKEGQDEAQTGIPTPQNLGSAITYMRRYALGAILGVAAEDDDDGAAASGTTKTSSPAKAEAPVSAKDIARDELGEVMKDAAITPEERAAFREEVKATWATKTTAEIIAYTSKWRDVIASRKPKAVDPELAIF